MLRLRRQLGSPKGAGARHAKSSVKENASSIIYTRSSTQPCFRQWLPATLYTFSAPPKNGCFPDHAQHRHSREGGHPAGGGGGATQSTSTSSYLSCQFIDSHS